MLALYLLIHCKKFKNEFFFPSKDTNKIATLFITPQFDATLKGVYSVNLTVPFFLTANSSKFLLGKIFENHYCDLKLIENKIDINYNLTKSIVLIGTYYYKIGCLILIKSLTKIFLYDRKNIFMIVTIKNIPKDKPSLIKSLIKSISFKENKNYLLRYFHLLFNFKSRLNIGIIEKLCNIKIDNIKDTELFFKKKTLFIFALSRPLNNIKLIELRRNRIFNFKIFPLRFREILIQKNNKFKNFSSGFLKCITSVRFFFKSRFFLSSAIFFLKKKSFFEINKSLFDWFFQLIKENCFQSLKICPFSTYFHLKTTINTQVNYIFDELSHCIPKKFNSKIPRDLIGFSCLENDSYWNSTVAVSELSLDIFLQVSRLSRNIDSTSSSRWYYSTQLILLYFFTVRYNYYFLKNDFVRHINRQNFFLKLNPQKFNYMAWDNIIFDNITFFKKKNPFFFKKEPSDIYQNNKVHQFLLIKKYW